MMKLLESSLTLLMIYHLKNHPSCCLLVVRATKPITNQGEYTFKLHSIMIILIQNFMHSCHIHLVWDHWSQIEVNKIFVWSRTDRTFCFCHHMLTKTNGYLCVTCACKSFVNRLNNSMAMSDEFVKPRL